MRKDIEILSTIITDSEDDARRFAYRPITAGELYETLNARIVALAQIMKKHLEDCGGAKK